MSRFRNRAGFTVIEVIVACALLLLLMSAVMSLMWSARDQRTRVGAISVSTRDVLATLDQIEADLTTAIAADPREGAGISGDDRSIRILFRSVWLRGSLSERAPRDLQGASYVFDEGASRIEGERWSASGDRSRATLCERVSDVRIRYTEGSGWLESFDAVERGRMPTAVEISVTTSRGELWRRTIRIPDSEGGNA